MNDDQHGLSPEWLFAFFFVAVVSTLSVGCPRTPAVSHCTPGSTSCAADGMPQACSDDQRWYPQQLDPCAAPVVCCETPLPYADAGNTHSCVAPALCVGGAP